MKCLPIKHLISFQVSRINLSSFKYLIMSQKIANITTQHFENVFKAKAELVVLSPGRINFIGEHIDYNDGFVMPAAIDKYVCLAVKKTNKQTASIIALDIKDKVEIDLNAPLVSTNKIWVNYFVGILSQMKKKLPKGVQVVFSSNLPIGAGLSSSAALTCGFAFALNQLFDLKYTTLQLAKMAQKTEHKFVGVKCGIMDQYANLFGKENYFLLLDCLSFEHKEVSIELNNYQVLLIDSQVKHSLLASGYNDRKALALKGKTFLMENFDEIKTFRDVTKKHLDFLKKSQSKDMYDSCKFVVEEIDRVQKTVKALSKNELEKVGKYLYQTHQGLSKLYHVSCDELDFLVAQAKQYPAVLGARMMGGGFGGCMIMIIEKTAVKSFTENVLKSYKEKFGIKGKAIQLKIAQGTHIYTPKK